MPRAAIGAIQLCILLLGLATVAGGCEPAAHISWSPDGTRAAYFVPTSGKLLPGVSYVLDANGKVSSDLGPTFGSFAWSTDSKAIYFGAYDKEPPAATAVVRKWLVDAEDQAPAQGPPNDEYPPMILSRWIDGKIEPLAPLGNRYVLFVQISPDQNWISVVTFAKETGSDGEPQLFAYNIASKKLYQVSDHSGYGACFTGPAKLAYVETDRSRGLPLTSGQIVEVKLDEVSEQLDRTPLVDVVPGRTTLLQPTEDGLLFTTMPRSFPTRSAKENNDRPAGLYHFTRANGGVAAMSETTTDLFMPSPDGKHILYIKLTPGTDQMPAKHELCTMNSNGSDEHVLRDVSSFGQQPPLWPAWHGNDEITFVAPTGADLPIQEGKDPRIAFDVLLYKINGQGALESTKTLSEGWPIEMKPSMKKADFTAPTAAK